MERRPALMKRLAGTCRETLDGRSAFIPPAVAPRCAFSNTSECSPTSDGVEQRRCERERAGGGESVKKEEHNNGRCGF